MKFHTANSFVGTEAWDATDIAEIDGASVRLHWTDKPYKWHVNDGQEVFVVIDGEIDMHYRKNGKDFVQNMVPGDICHADVGDEHVAHPLIASRVLVIERKGSV